VAHAYVKTTDTTRNITDTIEHNPLREADSHSAGITFLASLWNTNAHHKVRKQYGPNSHSHCISLRSTLTSSHVPTVQTRRDSICVFTSCIHRNDSPHLAFVTLYSYKFSTRFWNRDSCMSIPASTFNNKHYNISFSLQPSPVKVRLSLWTSWRHIGGVQVEFQSLLTSTLDRVCGQLHAPAVYPRRSAPGTH
jgi:hypothetical protein